MRWLQDICPLGCASADGVAGSCPVWGELHGMRCVLLESGEQFLSKTLLMDQILYQEGIVSSEKHSVVALTLP